MKQSRHIHHAHHHFSLSYPVSLRQRLYTIVLAPLVIFLIMFVVFASHTVAVLPSGVPISLGDIAAATAATMIRIAVAYVFAIVFGIALALLTVTSETAEAILLPIFDVLESIPILALFPVIIVLFIQFDFLNGAAVFILFLSMLWNIVFALVGGLKVIPRDVSFAARIFGLRGFSYVRRLVLPAVFPQLVTGSILAVGQGWNLIIVAEALHTYTPGGQESQDLFGIGSIMVHAATHAENTVFLASVFAMVTVIAAVNFFIWQKLLHYAQRFRFD